MDLSLTESQEMLRTTARSFMEREAPVDVVVGLQKAESSLDPELWATAARLGWVGIVLPVEYGGSGDSLSDAAVLYEELGRGPLPGAFFSSGVLGALTVLEAGSEEQRRRLLPGVASGERVLTVAITEPNTSWGPGGITLAPQGRNGSFVLNGAKLFVSDASSATDLIVAVRTVDAPADVRLLPCVARGQGVPAGRLSVVAVRGELRQRAGLVERRAGRATAGMGCARPRAREGGAAALRLHRRRLPGRLRQVGGLHADSRAVRRPHRPVPARARPRRQAREPSGQRALDDLGGALEARHRPARDRERPSGQGRRERSLPRGLQRGARGARRHGRADRVRAAGPHADVADPVPLSRRSALAQAPDGRRARVVRRPTAWSR